ncbi:MAG TPA: hypothetical protein VHD81_00610 [Mycobacteriales bacterium]|nr:hypothetical protein [Mycobacteriales bacterium]
MSELLVPERACLVHIGFPKTGTTSIQRSLHQARDEMRGLGVSYPGTDRYHKMPGIAITQAPGRLGDRPADERDWIELVDEVRREQSRRVIISSEWLSQATDEQAQRVVDDLGGDRVHILATLRPLAKILPSAWQQYLQNGVRVDYDTWLRGMLLEAPYDRPTPTFWKRHRHDEILARWAKAAGTERVTAIVVDSRDHDLLLRQFEALLGLPDGTLTPGPTERDNRSLSWGEAEMLRLVNAEFKKRKWPDGLYKDAIRNGVVNRLALSRPAATDLQSIPTPDWALDRAAEVGSEIADGIGSLGIRVVGDLDELRARQSSKGDAQATPTLPVGLAAEAVVAAIAAMRREQAKGPKALKAAAASAHKSSGKGLVGRLRRR